MKPKMIWANLSSSDLDRSTKFYTALGFKPNNQYISDELTSFTFAENGLIIHFFRKEILQRNLGLEISDAHKATEICFTISASSKEEADAWAKEVEPAGGKIIAPPATFGQGYYGFLFADPDGHKFNVLCM